MKYKIKINFTAEIESDEEDEVVNTFFENLEENNETAESFLCNIIEVKKRR